MTATGDPHASGERVGHRAEDMPDLPLLVDIGHHLQQRGAEGDYQAVPALDDCPRHGVGRGEVVFRIECPDPQIAPRRQPLLGQALQRPGHAVVQHRTGGELEDGDDRQVASHAGPVHAVRDQKQRGSGQDQQHAGKEPSNGIGNPGGDGTSAGAGVRFIWVHHTSAKQETGKLYKRKANVYTIPVRSNSVKIWIFDFVVKVVANCILIIY